MKNVSKEPSALLHVLPGSLDPICPTEPGANKTPRKLSHFHSFIDTGTEGLPLKNKYRISAWNAVFLGLNLELKRWSLL